MLVNPWHTILIHEVKYLLSTQLALKFEIKYQSMLSANSDVQVRDRQLHSFSVFTADMGGTRGSWNSR